MNDNKEKFTQLLIILIWLFIFIFFTRWYYSDLIGNLDINEEKNKIYKEKITELNTLSINKKELEKAESWKGKSAKYNEIKKYLEPISEDKIINEIYWMAENQLTGVKILSLSVWKWVENELGFKESKLNISAFANSKESIKDLFDYLNKKSKYKIFINSFNMPKKVKVTGYKIQIPATIFYVESK